LQLGLLIGGYLYFTRKTHDDHSAHHSEPSPPVEPPKAPKSKPLPPVTPAVRMEDLERGDRWVQSGRYDLALPIYQTFGPKMAAPLWDLVQYRVALCLEGLGRWDEAAAAYRELLIQNPHRQVVIAADVGLARVWLRRGHPVEARNLMGEMLLHAAADARLCPAALEDAQFLLALALGREATPAQPTGPPFERLIEVTSLPWSLERTLAWVNPSARTVVSWSKEEALSLGVGSVGLLGPANGFEPLLAAAALGARSTPRTEPEALAVQKIAARPQDSLVRAIATRQPLVPLLDDLAARCGVKTRWTARALQQTEGRLPEVHVAQVPFEDVAQELAYPLGLVWKVQNGVLSWSAVEEVTADDLAAFRTALARRALRAAVAAHPQHDLAATAYLSLGNLEAHAAQLPAAVAWYEQLIRDQPRSPLRVEAHYNLGLIQRRLGNDVTARQTFYRVVDLAPGHPLAAQAYLAVGRTWLNEGRPDQALPPLRRALANSTGSPVRPVIVLTLAASYLWTENPRAANAVLLAHRAEVGQAPYRQTAAFLDALSRFEAAADRRQTRHAGDLLAAILSRGEAAELGTLGVLLVGRAYQELGMIDQMTTVYEQALRQARGPLAEEMSFALAGAWESAGKVAEAKKLLLALAVQGDSRWVRAAKLRLAELTLKEKRPNETLSWGRQLLLVQPLDQLPALLELMGRAFEQLGDYEQAARCFRGEKPLDKGEPTSGAGPELGPPGAR
jgi:tetratricopeptide (TPR) repeat protein